MVFYELVIGRFGFDFAILIFKIKILARNDKRKMKTKFLLEYRKVIALKKRHLKPEFIWEESLFSKQSLLKRGF